MLVYAASIFLSAFLLFQVQPLIAKFILPWFGGSAAVWSAALLFFQLVLLAGYLYAHCLIRYLTPRQQFWTHASLLIASLATLPIVPSAMWKPSGGGRSDAAHSAAAGRDRRAALRAPFRDQSVAAGVVSADPRRRDSLSPLRALEFRIDAGAAQLSVRDRTSHGSLAPGAGLVHRLRRLRDALHIRSLAQQEGEWSRSSTCPPSAKPRPSELILWIGLAACASILLLSVSSHLTAEHRADPPALDRSSEPLSAELYPLF